MASRNLQLVPSASPRGDGPLLRRVNQLIAQCAVAAGAADSLVGASLETERERQCADCMPLVLDRMREELEQLAGELEKLEREPQT
jgi:hypothetical protein